MADNVLWKAVMEMRDGLVDADLGGCVVKKRVPRSGQGKRGGARTLVATKMADRWFFLFGFNKNERSNVSNRELRALQEMARDLLEMDDDQLAAALKAGEMVEVHNDSSKT